MNYCLILKKKKIKINGNEEVVFTCIDEEEQEMFIYENEMLDEKAVDDFLCDVNEYTTKKEAKYYYYELKSNIPLNEDIVAQIEELYVDKTFRLVDGELSVIDEEEMKESNSLTSISNIYDNIVGIVKGQDEHVKSILSSIVWNNKLNNSSLNKYDIAKNKHNILIMGNTGTGKTEIVRQISKNINVPMVVVDATTYTEAGYVGDSVDDMLVKLYMATDGDIEKAQKSILVIDEFDKLANQEEHKSSVNNKGVQKSLLTLIEGSERVISVAGEKKIFDTHGLTIILLGAFHGLEEEQHISNRMIGFSDLGFRTKEEKVETDLLNKLVRYGLEPEILGRVNKIRRLNNLTKETLISILQSPNGRFQTMLRILREAGIEILIYNEIYERLAQEAISDNKGARSLDRLVGNLIDEEFNQVMFGDKKKIKIK